jgi:hypothetical protein
MHVSCTVTIIMGGKNVLGCLSLSTFLSSRLDPLIDGHETTGRFASDLHVMLAVV